MTKRLHPSARTTLEVRDAIRESGESLKFLAREFGINPKTVAKWKKRASGDDLPPGPRSPNPRKLTAEQEEIIVRFREHTLLPLDDCLYALQARIPQLSRSSLHRCLQRHGLSRLAASSAGRAEATSQGAIHVGNLQLDLVAVSSAEGTHQLFIAIDQASRYAFVRMARSAQAADAVAFLDELARRAPFRIDAVSTKDSEPFAAHGRPSQFARHCVEHGIEHRLVRQLERSLHSQSRRMGQILQTAVTYDSEVYVSDLLHDFVRAYNYRRRLKTLGGRAPHAFICDAWQREPERFHRNPNLEEPEADE